MKPCTQVRWIFFGCAAVVMCGLEYSMVPAENIKDLSKGDCDVPYSDKCVLCESVLTVEYYIIYLLGWFGLYK